MSTIFPLVKSSTVHMGLWMRMVMAANFCLSKWQFRMSRLMARRFSTVHDVSIFAVPTRLCTCACSVASGGAWLWWWLDSFSMSSIMLSSMCSLPLNCA